MLKPGMVLKYNGSGVDYCLVVDMINANGEMVKYHTKNITTGWTSLIIDGKYSYEHLKSCGWKIQKQYTEEESLKEI